MISMNVLLATVVLTVGRADSLLMERNAELRMAALGVGEERAVLRQERLWENPEVDILYNVYNPITHRWFDPGREGEIDIALTQPIPIGGQRRERIRKAQSTVEATEQGRLWTAWLLRMEMHRTLCDALFLQEKVEAFDTEIASTGRIVAAWRRQLEQGNVSQTEVARMEALRLRLMREQNEVAESLAERKQVLRVMLGLRVNEELRMKNEEFAAAFAEQEFSSSCTRAIANSSSFIPNSSFFILNSSFIQSKRHATEAARHDLRLQRANALPRIGVKAEYDRNGNICRNFWGVGLSLSVPLFDRNQGSIRQAALAVERLRTEEEAARHQAEAELARCYEQLHRRRQLLTEAQQTSIADWNPDALERQLLSRNLSLLEFIDLYDAWREAHILLIEARRDVVQAAIDLNEKAGTEVIAME